MTMINRSAPHAVPGLALIETELVLLDRLVPDKPQARTSARTLSSYLIKVARLGGYLARSRDPPPGNIVMWRGLSRLTDITPGLFGSGHERSVRARFAAARPSARLGR
jgi:hypothetical protein